MLLAVLLDKYTITYTEVVVACFLAVLCWIRFRWLIALLATLYAAILSLQGLAVITLTSPSMSYARASLLMFVAMNFLLSRTKRSKTADEPEKPGTNQPDR